MTTPGVHGDPTGPVVASLYVHVPFCERQCGYCDFAIAVGRLPDAQAWLDAVATEWRQVRDAYHGVLADAFDTLYVGGGTPSMLGTALMPGLAALFGPDLLGGDALEWTGEANPESLTPTTVESWREAGVTRLSLGVQTFHEATLQWMGRLHGPQGGQAALELALAAGFESVTLDLIFGLPGSLDRSWTHDLERVVDSGVPHVSLYGLTVEEGTPLARHVATGRSAPVDEDQYAEEYLQAAEVLTGAGYEHYEVSSFAKAGHRSRHNQRYWSGVPYLGIGNGAHSFIPPIRSWNLWGWPEYRDRLAAGESPVADRERIEGDAEELERIWLGLRTIEGVAAETLKQVVADRWCREGLAERVTDRLRLTPQGWLLLDQLAVEATGTPAKGVQASPVRPGDETRNQAPDVGPDTRPG